MDTKLEALWPWIKLGATIGTSMLPPPIAGPINLLLNEYQQEANRQGISQEQLIENIRAKFASYDKKSGDFQTQLDKDRLAGKT